MGILDQYKKAIEEEEENMDFPTGNTTLTEQDKEAYETALKKMRKGEFSKEEIEEATNNSKKNMSDLEETHTGGSHENNMMVQLTRITDSEMFEQDLLNMEDISAIKVLRAYCPKCGKELKAKAPAMYNPFTMQKVCVHECCGTKYNLDRTYPHIAFYDENESEIEAFF